ncbi:MAG: hypothetical protein WDZ60_03025, partial [Wenzhouxiangellaceae bacterium]
EYVSGALGRETPQPRHLAVPRDGGVMNKAGLEIARTCSGAEHCNIAMEISTSGSVEYSNSFSLFLSLSVFICLYPCLSAFIRGQKKLLTFKPT